MTQKHKKKNVFLPKKPAGKILKIIPLGGQEEVGRNMTVFEYGQDIVIIDMGLQFPEENMPGIDYIIPNTKYLQAKERQIRGVIFTHGHMDHIGAAPILLEKLGNPSIIARPLTLALIKNRQEDFKEGSAKKLKAITVKSTRDKLRLGEFTVRFFPVDHSIMDAIGIILETPKATIIHTGDWTYEKDPLGRPAINYRHLASLRKPTVLMMESLAATNTNPRVPEKVVYANLEKLIAQAPGRIIIGTFSSQIERIKNLIPMAEKYGRKIAFDGYSMRMNVEVARKLGYIKFQKDTVVPIKKISDFPDKRILILCTGAQGEPEAVLSRMVDGSHKYVEIKKQDTIIFSSSVIPGNERTIQRLKDSIYRLSDNVIHSDIMDVHTSGHSTAADMVEILKQIRPTYFLPVYANHYFLKEAAKLAKNNGFSKDNIFILDNGSTLEFSDERPRLSPNKVPSNYVMVDGLGVGDVGEVVLRDRNVLAQDGMVVIIVKVDDKKKQLVDEPDIISRGFVYMKGSDKLMADTKQKVKDIFNGNIHRKTSYWAPLQSKIREDIGQYLFNKTERRPMVLPVLIEV